MKKVIKPRDSDSVLLVSCQNEIFIPEHISLEQKIGYDIFALKAD